MRQVAAFPSIEERKPKANAAIEVPSQGSSGTGRSTVCIAATIMNRSMSTPPAAIAPTYLPTAPRLAPRLEDGARPPCNPDSFDSLEAFGPPRTQ